MNALRYRPRLLEIEAIKLSDGRYLLLTEEPCYMDGEEFEASYELIRERRAGGGADRTARPAHSGGDGAGRKKPWACRECAAETLGGVKCSGCGKYTRYARAAAAEE